MYIIHNKIGTNNNLPHVALLIAELPVGVALHTLQELALHLCSCGGGGGIALGVPVAQLLAVGVRELSSRQWL